jgi:hypothetical protein
MHENKQTLKWVLYNTDMGLQKLFRLKSKPQNVQNLILWAGTKVYFVLDTTFKSEMRLSIIPQFDCNVRERRCNLCDLYSGGTQFKSGTEQNYLDVCRGFIQSLQENAVVVNWNGQGSHSIQLFNSQYILIIIIIMHVNPFKVQWKLYATPALTISNSSFCIYVFRMILTVNSDYFLKQR